MSVSAILAVSPSVSTAGQQIKLLLTLINSAGGTAVGVLRVNPYISGTNTVPSAGIQNLSFNIGQSTLLGASSTTTTTLVISGGAVVFAPVTPLNPPYPNSPAYDVYTLGVNIDMSDGTVVSASSSIYVYPQTTDGFNSSTSIPQTGQMFFAQNTESALIGALWQP